MSGRAVAALLLVGAAAGAVLWLSGGPQVPGSVPPVAPANGNPTGGTGDGDGTGTPAAAAHLFQSASECRACHEDVYAEWKESYHGMAWTDPMVQALSNGFRKTECIDCHAPQPIHITGVDQRVAPRSHARQDGVDCISCHLLPDRVSVAAGRDVDTSGVEGACRPVATPAMTDGNACAGCHNQHETLNELAASGLDATCLTCHMEPVERRTATADGTGVRPGRAHRFPGSHSEEMLRRAVALDLRVEDETLVARVSNVGGGHHIPTDSRHRSLNLWVEVRDSRGNIVQAETEMQDGEFRLYYRDDFLPSTQIAHGKHREGTHRLVPGLPGKARVRLTYALNPEDLGLGKVTELLMKEIDLP